MGERGSDSIDERYWKLHEESEIPIEIPEHILEMRRKSKELDNPDLSFERWRELGAEHEARMKGDSDDDLYYQLAVLQGMKEQSGGGIGIQKSVIERKIRERREQK